MQCVTDLHRSEMVTRTTLTLARRYNTNPKGCFSRLHQVVTYGKRATDHRAANIAKKLETSKLSQSEDKHDVKSSVTESAAMTRQSRTQSLEGTVALPSEEPPVFFFSNVQHKNLGSYHYIIRELGGEVSLVGWKCILLKLC